MSETAEPKSEDRAARIAEIRRQIAAGTYDTPERMEAVLDAFLDRLQPRSG